MRTKIGGLSGVVASVTSLLAVVVTMASAMLVGVGSVRAQGFTETFDTIGPDWQIVGSPLYFQSVYVGNGNYGLFFASRPGGLTSGATRAITGAGPGDWSVGLGLYPSGSYTQPGGLGYMCLVAGLDNGQSVTLALGTTGGVFGAETIDLNGNVSALMPYTFTQGFVQYQLNICSVNGTINMSFGGVNLFTAPGAGGRRLTSISLLTAGNMDGYLVDDAWVTVMAPEPTTFALAGLGLATLVIFRRRSL